MPRESRKTVIQNQPQEQNVNNNNNHEESNRKSLLSLPRIKAVRSFSWMDVTGSILGRNKNTNPQNTNSTNQNQHHFGSSTENLHPNSVKLNVHEIENNYEDDLDEDVIAEEEDDSYDVAVSGSGSGAVTSPTTATATPKSSMHSGKTLPMRTPPPPPPPAMQRPTKHEGMEI